MTGVADVLRDCRNSVSSAKARRSTTHHSQWRNCIDFPELTSNDDLRKSRQPLSTADGATVNSSYTKAFQWPRMRSAAIIMNNWKLWTIPNLLPVATFNEINKPISPFPYFAHFVTRAPSRVVADELLHCSRATGQQQNIPEMFLRGQ